MINNMRPKADLNMAKGLTRGIGGMALPNSRSLGDAYKRFSQDLLDPDGPVVDGGDPVTHEDRFCVEWAGKVCPLGNTDEFRLMRLLIWRIDTCVSHMEIAEIAMDNPDATANAVRNLKHRLCRSLRKHGMQGLAERIVADREHYRLSRIPRHRRVGHRNKPGQ
jgi:hypothetical protein